MRLAPVRQSGRAHDQTNTAGRPSLSGDAKDVQGAGVRLEAVRECRLAADGGHDPAHALVEAALPATQRFSSHLFEIRSGAKEAYLADGEHHTCNQDRIEQGEEHPKSGIAQCEGEKLLDCRGFFWSFRELTGTVCGDDEIHYQGINSGNCQTEQNDYALKYRDREALGDKRPRPDKSLP